MTIDDTEPSGWGAPCEARPDTPIRIRIGQSRVAINAYVFGAWAVHQATGVAGFEPRPDPKSWGVSHVPTGCSIGLALELGFWDAVRIARALDDTGIAPRVDLAGQDMREIFEAAIGAALHDHYVWPMPTVAAP